MDEDSNERARAKSAQELKQLQSNMPHLMEAERLLAKVKRVKYVALVMEGFTESQALDLCKDWRN